MDDSANSDAIAVEGLECHYGTKVILRDITFSVRRNEIFVIAGQSGCGKSTLLRHLLGLQTPFQGRIAYFGRDLTGADMLERRRIFRLFGVLFQEGALWSDMSLEENISLPLYLHTKLPRHVRGAVVALKLAQVGLAGYQKHFPSELSGGMQRRAALARALALDPTILFFDEPTAGLDPITARQIDQLILQMRETVGATIVVVSHRIPTIFSIADRVVLLDAATRSIVAEGTPTELSQTHENSLVRDFFQKEACGANQGQSETD